ncbi:MAG: hypothetical protein GH152_01785 [Dehalococcoidia bacterium]|nr:hypothetical protein [Dehalococcoidia bacterium]
MTYQIDNEINISQRISEALKVDDSVKAASLPEDYIAFLKQDYRGEHLEH